MEKTVSALDTDKGQRGNSGGISIIRSSSWQTVNSASLKDDEAPGSFKTEVMASQARNSLGTDKKFLEELEALRTLNENSGSRLRQLLEHVERVLKESKNLKVQLNTTFSEMDMEKELETKAKMDAQRLRDRVADLESQLNVFCKQLYDRITEKSVVKGMKPPVVGSLLHSVRTIGDMVRYLKPLDENSNGGTKDEVEESATVVQLRKQMKNVQQRLEEKMRQLKRERAKQEELEKILNDVNCEVFDMLQVELSADEGTSGATAKIDMEEKEGTEANDRVECKTTLHQSEVVSATRQALINVTKQLEQARRKRDELEIRRQKNSEELRQEHLKQLECFHVLMRMQEYIKDCKSKYRKGDESIKPAEASSEFETLLDAGTGLLNEIWGCLYSTENRVAELKAENEEERESLQRKQRQCADLSQRYEAICEEVRDLEQEYYQDMEDTNERLRNARAEILQLHESNVNCHRDFSGKFQQMYSDLTTAAIQPEERTANATEQSLSQEERIQTLEESTRKLDLLNELMKEHIAHERCHIQELKRAIGTLLVNQMTDLRWIQGALRRKTDEVQKLISGTEEMQRRSAESQSLFESRKKEIAERSKTLRDKMAQAEALCGQVQNEYQVARNQLDMEDCRLEGLTTKLSDVCASYVKSTRSIEELRANIANIEAAIQEAKRNRLKTDGSTVEDEGETPQGTEDPAWNVWQHKADIDALQQMLIQEMQMENMNNAILCSDAATLEQNRMAAVQLEKANELLRMKIEWMNCRKAHSENGKAATIIMGPDVSLDTGSDASKTLSESSDLPFVPQQQVTTENANVTETDEEYRSADDPDEFSPYGAYAEDLPSYAESVQGNTSAIAPESSATDYCTSELNAPATDQSANSNRKSMPDSVTELPLENINGQEESMNQEDDGVRSYTLQSPCRMATDFAPSNEPVVPADGPPSSLFSDTVSSAQSASFIKNVENGAAGSTLPDAMVWRHLRKAPMLPEQHMPGGSTFDSAEFQDATEDPTANAAGQ